MSLFGLDCCRPLGIYYHVQLWWFEACWFFYQKLFQCFTKEGNDHSGCTEQGALRERVLCPLVLERQLRVRGWLDSVSMPGTLTRVSRRANRASKVFFSAIAEP